MALLRLFPLTLLPALHGCSVFSSLPRETLHIAVVEMGGVSATAGIDHAELAKPVVEAFRRLNPNVELRIRNLPEQDLVQVLRLQQQRGLEPDLLLVRAPVAISLRRAGLVDTLPNNAAMRQTLASIEPSALQRVRERGQLVGLPVAKEITLACYDRKRMARAPRTLQELQALAASGSSIGVAVEPIGIWWTAGPFGAHGPSGFTAAGPGPGARFVGALAAVVAPARPAEPRRHRHRRQRPRGVDAGPDQRPPCLDSLLQPLPAGFGSGDGAALGCGGASLRT